jgi:hypothetical protein
MIIGFGVQAQDMAKSFNPEKYAKDLTEKIVTVLELQDEGKIKAVERETYQYAMSTHKHILLYDKKGLTQGKTLDEVLEMINNDVKIATGFERQLGEILGSEAVEKLKKLNVF